MQNANSKVESTEQETMPVSTKNQGNGEEFCDMEECVTVSHDEEEEWVDLAEDSDLDDATKA